MNVALENSIPHIKQQIMEGLDLEQELTDEELLEIIENQVFQNSEELQLTAAEIRQLVQRLFHSFRGLDVLQPLLEDMDVTEIMINSYDEIFTEKFGEVSLQSLCFESQEKLEDIIQTIVGKVNRIVNESQPIVDARLKDGSRVNVVLPPIALKGPTLTIRKFPKKPMQMEDLIKRGALTQESCDWLNILVRSKHNIFISGGTSSGKTTFLNALSQYVPEDERIITIEDSAELQLLTIPNLVRMETRNANSEGKGEITMRGLIRTALRMRPDRIIVGEVRGEEAMDMLQAMNTGHEGSFSTGHANSAADMLSRLETMVYSGTRMPVEVIRKQMASALDIIIHLARISGRSRKVMEISEVVEYRGGDIILNPLFQFQSQNRSEPLDQGALVRTENRLQNENKLRLSGLHIPE